MTTDYNYKLASPGVRFLAHLINGALMGVICLAFFVAITKANTLGQVLTGLLDYIVYSIYAYTGYSLIMAFLVSRFKANPGQLLVGIEVIKKDGMPLNFKEAFFRETIGNMLSGSLFGLGYFWIFKKGETQNWHDMTTNNLVVEKTKRLFFSIAVLAILLGINIWQGVKIANNIVKNLPYYQTIIEDVRSEIENNLPHPEIPEIV